jgi:hypothetical protein
VRPDVDTQAQFCKQVAIKVIDDRGKQLPLAKKPSKAEKEK